MCVVSKVYRGARRPDESPEALVTVNDRVLSAAPSQRVRNHSPNGFEWGYGGSGPAQLALALLLDVTGDSEQAEDQYQDFKRQFVANWGDEWEITEAQIRDWLALSRTVAE